MNYLCLSITLRRRSLFSTKYHLFSCYPKKALLWRKLGAFLGFFCFISVVAAEDISIGMTTALQGPAKDLGLSMQQGVLSYFNYVNDQGGIKGNKLKLITMDDQYEPKNAAPNMQKLLSDDKVLAVIGNVGTPTAVVTVPIANKEKTLLFGAFTGAGLLRQTPPDRYVINYRASYAEETAEMIRGLLSIGIKPEEIAFFTQNDAYGDAGYSGAMKALAGESYTDANKLTHVRYRRNTSNVEAAVGELIESEVEPKAIIMVGAYSPCAKFIKLVKKDFPDILFLNVSFVGSVALLNALAEQTKNVIVTQVVPHYESEVPAVQQYREVFKRYFPDERLGFVSLEGFLAAKLFVLGLEHVSGKLTRENLIDGIHKIGQIDFGINSDIKLTPTEHQASHKVWPTIISANKYVELHWANLHGF